MSVPRILVINDEAPLRDFFRFNLKVRGYEVMETIGSPEAVHIIIAFNMRGTKADKMRCLEMGVDDYLDRPFGVDELMARVSAVLRKRRWMQLPALAGVSSGEGE